MNAAILNQSRAAHVTRDGLAALAPLRRAKDLWIGETADGAWVEWNGEMPAIVSALLPVPGVVFYSKKGTDWLPIHAAIPDFSAPKFDKAQMIAADRALVPELVSAVPPVLKFERVLVTLVDCDLPRRTTAIRCDLRSLMRWSERATNWEIGRLRGAICEERVLLRGDSLPVLAGAERFWGDRVLVPLGLRPEPDWPEKTLREAAGIDDSEILVLTPQSAEAIPMSSLQTLSRAGIRMLQEK
jgi:hypothetical protein